MWKPSNKLISLLQIWISVILHTICRIFMNFLPKGAYERTETSGKKQLPKQSYLHSACHEKTGLSAEYADYDGKPHTGHKEIFGRHDWYYSDAYRTIANMAMDHLWFDADPWQIKTAENLQKFYCEDQKDNWDGVFLIDARLMRRHFIR